MVMVSIIVPVYNVDRYLEDCINSVLDQTYKDFELILVDDGSTDSSPAICDRFADLIDNVRVIHQNNMGQTKARWNGVKSAVGEYILFLDGDDTIRNDTLLQVVKAAIDNNDDVTIFGAHIIKYNRNIIVSESYRELHQENYICKDEVEKNFVKMNNERMWNFLWDKLIKRSIIVNNHIKGDSFYDGAGEDTVFLLELFPYVERISVINGCYYEYAIRDDQSVVESFIPDRFSKFYGRFLKTKQIMNTLNPEYYDENFIFSMYCTIIVWAYEFMFHKDCTYSLIERYKYIKNTFSIRMENREFSKKAFDYFSSLDSFFDLSRTTKIVLKSILKGHYSLAWLSHIVALLKNRVLVQVR